MKYSEYFEIGKRKEGNEFSRLKKDAPEELTFLIRTIHTSDFDCLPNDWIYSVIYEALEALESDSIDNVYVEADCYYSELLEWLSNPYAATFCNEYMQDFPAEQKDIYKLIGMGQWLAKDRIYNRVNEFIECHTDDNKDILSERNKETLEAFK